MQTRLRMLVQVVRLVQVRSGMQGARVQLQPGWPLQVQSGMLGARAQPQPGWQLQVRSGM